MNQTLDFLAIYSISHAYGKVHLDDLTFPIKIAFLTQQSSKVTSLEPSPLLCSHA